MRSNFQNKLISTDGGLQPSKFNKNVLTSSTIPHQNPPPQLNKSPSATVVFYPRHKKPASGSGKHREITLNLKATLCPHRLASFSIAQH